MRSKSPSTLNENQKTKRKSVLMIGTGGTIACEATENGLAPLRNDAFFRRIRQHPLLTSPSSTPPQPCTPMTLSQNASSYIPLADVSWSSPVYVQTLGKDTKYPKLVTPELDEEGRDVEYEILVLDTYMDSSEMTPAEWNTIASLLHENYTQYDGFVILSGTDTLAYTASILSFLFHPISKPILITGAQIPLSKPRSDGWSNILDSLFVAGVLGCRGVGIVFNHQLLSGTRTTKTSPNHFKAFTSPCILPLVNLNVKITMDPTVSTSLSSVPSTSMLPPPLIPLITAPTVLSIHIYPGFSGQLLSAQIAAVPSCRAVILSAYGGGHLPLDLGNGVLDALKQMVHKEVLVVVISQCAIPNVYPLYAQGRTLLEAGVLPGYDLTHEAAFAKLLWLVSRTDLTFKDRQQLFEQPIVGEMTV
nr:asparaginase [Cryptococcus depauperatus CBS 7841]